MGSREPTYACMRALSPCGTGGVPMAVSIRALRRWVVDRLEPPDSAGSMAYMGVRFRRHRTASLARLVVAFLGRERKQVTGFLDRQSQPGWCLDISAALGWPARRETATSLPLCDLNCARCDRGPVPVGRRLWAIRCGGSIAVSCHHGAKPGRFGGARHHRASERLAVARRGGLCSASCLGGPGPCPYPRGSDGGR